jgi:hypothetical protein
MGDNGGVSSNSDHSLAPGAEPATYSSGWPQFRDRRLDEFLESYLQFGAEDKVPKRSEIDPLKIARLLPEVWLYKYFPDTDRFFCELAGETASNAWRPSMMKRWADEVFEPLDYAVISQRWKRVMGGKVVLHASYAEESRFRYVERVAVPVSDETGGIVYVFGASVYNRATERITDQAPAEIQAITYFEIAGLRRRGDSN